jgi:hypothetical protein
MLQHELQQLIRRNQEYLDAAEARRGKAGAD